MPGFDLVVLDASGEPLEPPAEGTLALRLPLPPGTLPTLWRNDEGFVNTYLAPFSGYYFTGDSGSIDEDGYVFVMGRVDDIINVAGHRLSTGRMEEVLAAHPDVAECAVVGAADDLKGQVPLGLVVLKDGAAREPEEVVAELVRMVREQVGPVAAFKRALVVERLPKTRSGKILRSAIRKIADGVDFAVPATIEDASVIEDLRAALGDDRRRSTPLGARLPEPATRRSSTPDRRRRMSMAPDALEDLAELIIAGDGDAAKALTARLLAEGLGGPRDPRRRPHARHGHRRGAHEGRAVLHPRGAAQRTHHAGLPRADQAAARGRRQRPSAAPSSSAPSRATCTTSARTSWR